jgi:LmbE family N-acetylglucosaminyl deacetylase
LDDYHTDHRTAGALAEAASWLASSAGQMTTPPALELPAVLWWMDTINMSGFEPHFYIDVSNYIDLKRRMLACHRSQLERGKDAAFSPLEQLMMRQSAARGDQAGVAAAEAFRSHTAWKRARAW